MRRLKRIDVSPAETLERFERSVQPGERSETVAGLIVHWLEQRERDHPVIARRAARPQVVWPKAHRPAPRRR